MPVYMVRANERIFQIGYVRAGSREEAEEIAKEDWLLEWETIDGEDFQIDDIEEVPEDEVADITNKIATIEEYAKYTTNYISSSGCPVELPLTGE